MKVRTTILGGAGVLALAMAVSWWIDVSVQEAPPAASEVPRFEYDKTWPKPLPNAMKVGQVVGVNVDSRDHVWIVQRPASLKNSEMEATSLASYSGMQGPVAGCCRPAPPVIEFDQEGNLVQAWGGPAEGLDWPTPGPPSLDSFYGSAPFGERGIYVDFNDNVWLGADGLGDSQILKMSRFGQRVLQVGSKGRSQGSQDTENLHGAAGIAVDPETNETFVADGLHNRRVIVFDAYSGEYLRHWGAYGNVPDDSVEVDAPDVGSQQFGDVHCIALSNDKLVYVCDRANNRIQVFRTDGTFVSQGTVAPQTLGGTTYGIAFSADPEQRFAYVADGTNEKVWILDRRSMETVGSFGSGGHFGGQFTTAHSIATDSHGNIYVGETWEGKRVQRFKFMGLRG